MCTESSNEARVCDTCEMTPVIVTATYRLFVLLFCVLSYPGYFYFSFLKVLVIKALIFFNV
jgi:hypothetical protein